MIHSRFMLQNIFRLGAPRACLATNSDYAQIESMLQSKSDVILDIKREDKIALLAMNRQPSRNSLSKSFVQEMSEAVKELEVDEKSIALVIFSLVPNVFCAGADLRERSVVADADVPEVVGSLRSLFQRVHRLGMPTIAAIDGAALGGGLELALACDVRFAGAGAKTRVGLVESHWALLPGAGGSQRLPRLIGAAKAKELMFAARILSAEEAASTGVVNAVVKADDVDATEWRGRPGLWGALAFARQLTTKGPLALRQAKCAIDTGLAADSLEAGLRVEGECYARLVPTADRKEGMKAFAEKRQPVYHGC